MDASLTVTVDPSTLEKAENYARQNNQSLPELVQKYLQFLANLTEDEEPEMSPIVRELAGVISLDSSSDVRAEYHEYLSKKHNS